MSVEITQVQITATRPLSGSSGRLGFAPSRAELVDIGFLAVLCVTALDALRSSYAGWAFLAMGFAGLIAGTLASHVAGRVIRSAAVAVATAVAGYFVIGVPVLCAGAGLGIAAPTPGAVAGLADTAVQCWKQLLTTQPPVSETQSLLAVPLILGLFGATAGVLLAQRVSWPAAPIAAPVAVLILACALGTDQTTDWPVTATLFAVTALAWTAHRSRRGRRRTSAGRSAQRVRILIAAAALLAAAAAASAVEPWLPGANAQDRSILRDRVTPPLDLADYPSPLVGFHKYTKDADQLWGQTLMTVTGLPTGTPIAIAVLDDYDGSVWGADNSALGDEFEPFTSTPRPTAVADARSAATTTTTVRITIEPAYARASDVDAWLPTAGTVAGVTFSGSGSQALAGSLWYNAQTGTGIVTDRLQAGDTVVLHTSLSEPSLPADVQPYGVPALTNGYQTLFASRAAAWGKGAAGLTARLKAIATYLRENGAYSDGGPGESQYLPGHSIGRLTGFLNGDQPVGDDEQYAAAYALMADSLGIPARVVFGAMPEADGVVRGSDIHAWVQVHVSSGAWINIPYTQFMPDHTKAPAPVPPQTERNAAAVVVPPPDPVRPPTSNAPPGASGTPAQNHAAAGSSLLPAWLVALLETAALIASPALAVLAALGVIQGCKARRRHRRRTRGSPADRFAAGWLELVDHARDLGCAVPAGITRQQQAQRLAGSRAGLLARTADAAVYGPGDPAAALAATYWREIDAARRELTSQAGRRRRLRAAFDIRTLFPAGRGLGAGLGRRPAPAKSAAGPRFGLGFALSGGRRGSR